MLFLLFEALWSFNIWFVSARYETLLYSNPNAHEMVVVLYRSLLNVVQLNVKR